MRRRMTVTLATTVIAVWLAGCGHEVPREPPTAPLATAPAGSHAARPAPRATPRPDLPGTPLPGETTVGRLADQIGAAWRTVRSYRAIQTSASLDPAGSPVAATAPMTVVDEVVLPDRRRRVLLEDGKVVGEVVALAGQLFVRGSLMPGAPPVASPTAGEWSRIDPATLATPAPMASVYAALLQPAAAPYSRLSPDERGRIAHSVGTVVVHGRVCRAFAIADTTMTGERVEIVLAVGEDHLPCSIRTRVGAGEVTTVYEYNVPLEITAPI